MSNANTTADRGFKAGQSGSLRGRPTKIATVLKRAHLNIIGDLESRALNGDAVARNELFEMIARTGAR
jgi:hypothetical protein